MTKNPFLNALAAAAYILLVVSAINFLPHDKDIPNQTFVMPLMVLSMLTLSAAVMGYIFGSQPLQLFLEGKKKEAVELFVKTVAIFAIVPVVIVIVISSGLLS